MEDNRELVFVVTSSGQLKLKWQTSLGGSFTSSWTTQSTPTTVKDGAVTGGAGNRMQLFALGTNNALYTSYKTGDSNSAWSSWANLGVISGANAIAAVRWSGMSVAFISSSSGAFATWRNEASFASSQDLGTSAAGFRAISAGLLQDGRIHLQAVDTSGASRLVDGSWSSLSGLGFPNPPNTTGFVSLATGQVADGREQLLAIATSGEIYQTWELPGGFANRWVRFYK
jgi:hypothetical protein